MQNCNLCRSQKLFHLSNEYVRCRNCGIIYNNSKLGQEIYLNDIINYYTKVDDTSGVAQSRRLIYLDFLKQIDHLKKGNSKILDVGCGNGYFLSLAKEKGWDTQGIEIAPQLIEQGIRNYNIDIQTGSFEKADFPENYFDVITFWDVFYELADPDNVLSKVREILKPKGLVFFRIKNASFHYFVYRINRIIRLLRLEKLIPKHSFMFHKWTFSNKSMQFILKNNGFIKIKIRNSTPTTGNPYNTERFIILTKKIIKVFSKIIFILSSHGLTICPSLDISAQNGKD